MKRYNYKLCIETYTEGKSVINHYTPGDGFMDVKEYIENIYDAARRALGWRNFENLEIIMEIVNPDTGDVEEYTEEMHNSEQLHGFYKRMKRFSEQCENW